jgi:hypothetical protein
MQGDEAELAGLHAFHDRFDAGVVLFLDLAVAPKDEHIGLIERGIAEALIGIGESGGLYDEVFVLGQLSGERLAEELVAVTLRLLRLLFVPDEHADLLRLGRNGEEGEEGEEKAHEA